MTDRPWTCRRYIVVDVEGNGQRPPELLELAVVPVVDGRIGDVTTWLVKPKTPISSIAQRIHGITSEMVADAPAFTEVEAQVRAALADRVLVAHNAAVDLAVLQRMMPDFRPAEVLDTLKLARRLLPDQPNHRLGSLAEALDLAYDLPDRPHRAAYDALVTARLFCRLATRPDGSPLSFAQLCDRPGGGAADALF